MTLENGHSRNASFAMNNFFINKVKEKAKIISIKFWSDASQFHSQLAFYLITKFDRDVELQWHYTLKPIMVKHAVFRHVLSKQIAIKSPKHFAEYAYSILPLSFLLMMKISSPTFMKNVERNYLYIWHITNSFRNAPNEWHETQAKI